MTSLDRRSGSVRGRDGTTPLRARLVLAFLVAAALVAGAARADGTLGLGEVLAAVHSPARLVAEIEGELDTAKLAASQVVCLGARHGNHWTFLGGARAAPYRCRFGGRELTIEADRTYFDAAGRRIGDLDGAAPRKAKTFRESNVRWTWTAKAGVPPWSEPRPVNR